MQETVLSMFASKPPPEKITCEMDTFSASFGGVGILSAATCCKRINSCLGTKMILCSFSLNRHVRASQESVFRRLLVVVIKAQIIIMAIFDSFLVLFPTLRATTATPH